MDSKSLIAREVAGVVLEQDLRRCASALAPGDAQQQHDLFQEMAQAIWKHSKPAAKRAYWLSLAECRARDALRKHWLRCREDLKRAACARADGVTIRKSKLSREERRATAHAIDRAKESITRCAKPPEGG